MQLYKAILVIFLGGGTGSVLRYLISKWLNPISGSFFLGTFAVNILGCLIIGLISGWVLRTQYIDQTLSLLLITGFCGGFTTFSTFSLENLNLIRGGDLNQFVIYSMISLITGIAAVMAGIWLGKSLG